MGLRTWVKGKFGKTDVKPMSYPLRPDPWAQAPQTIPVPGGYANDRIIEPGEGQPSSVAALVSRESWEDRADEILGDREWDSFLNLSSDARLMKVSQLQALIQTIEENSGKADLWRQCGRLFHAEGDIKQSSDFYVQALTSYEKAIEFNPKKPESWYGHGCVLSDLGRNEEAISSYERAIEFKLNYHQAWHNRGLSLHHLERCNEAIESYDQAIEIKPDKYESWSARGYVLSDLGRYEEAIESCKKSIEIKSDYHFAWFNRGCALSNLGRYEEAIKSFDITIKLKPDYCQAWFYKGIDLYINLDQYEDAITCFDNVIKFNPDDHETWLCQGFVLYKLGRYEEALISCDKAIECESDLDRAWTGRGHILGRLGRYEESIASFDKSIEFKPDDHEAWYGRGIAAASSRSSSPYPLPIILNQRPANLHHKHPELNQRGYDGQVASLTVGLTSCPADSHPLGQGVLQRSLGDAHYNRAKLQRFPRPNYFKALKAYEATLTVLTVTDHPEERLQTLQRLVRVHFALKTNAETIAALIRQGAELRDRILTQAKSQPQRDRLHRTLPNFNEFTVDLHLRQGETIRAIETAEADKNGLMQWLLPTTETPTYSQMQDWIGDRTVVYWHFSAIALTTFILNSECGPIVLHHTNPETALKQRNELETWIENWNTSYNTHLNQTKKSENPPAEISEWRNSLETQLQTLAEILDIPTLTSHLDPNRALTLIPHRDLHRLPLPSFFPDFLVTSLPSIQLGRNLRPTQSLHDGNLLNLPAPTHQDTAPLPEASLESIALDRLFQTHSIPVHTIDRCTLAHLQTALPQDHTHLHFNGHAYYNDQNPKASALALQGKDLLTVADLSAIDLHHYQLITLASCETALTGNQTITAEYVGLVSALLSHRIPHILSTLWTVQSNASSLLILQFYRQLLKGNSPTQALRSSQHWLQTLTNRKLDRLYRTVLSNITSKTAPTSAESRIEAFLESECDELGRMEPHQKPYQDPYFWAAFILAGRH